MFLSGYLVITKNMKQQYKTSARFTKTKPSTSYNEIAVKIECNIPDQLFVQPQLKFVIDIPKESVPQKEITAEVKGNIQDIIQQNLGIDIHLISEPTT